MSSTRLAGSGIEARQCLAAANRSPRASQMNRCEAETTLNIHRFRTRVPVSPIAPPANAPEGYNDGVARTEQGHR